MDWRSIKNDPPAPGTGIRTTDGKSVFAGQIRPSDIPDYTWFMGTDLDDGSQICLAPDELTEWMPLENQPENFTQKVERIISEIHGMMGEKMYYGEMVGAPVPYCHCGPMVYENPEDYNLEKAADILQGALDGNFLGDPDLMPEKSADEMFRELGYTVKKCDGILESVTYSKPKNRSKTVDEISCDRNGVFTAYHKFGGFETFCMNSREVHACARLIEEMEDSNG